MSGREQGWRILVVSDQVREIAYSPSILTQFGRVDLVISCGDLPFSYLEYVLTMLDVPLLYVPGNHDRPIHTSSGRTVAYPEGAVNIDGRAYTVRSPNRRSLRVVGLGGSMYYGGAANQYTEWNMRKRVAMLDFNLSWNRWIRRRGIDLLITHAPAFGIHDGSDRCHTGFRAFLGFIRRHRPMYHLHGHTHPSYGYETKPRQYHETEIRNIYGVELLEIQT